ncbi:hypothetical protein ACFQ88_33120 [Paenibacillus sp. NPDC056579]|uniref:hypothetical protein n=1 Tax=Paenibacillus sp. NPDC056579 TaxID=3345871 RepID=UPI0036952B3C
MFQASRSVRVFGAYLALLGIALFLIPGFLRELLRLADLPTVWLRFIGELLFFLGVYYVLAAWKRWTEFFYVSVVLRILVFLSIVSFVFMGLMPSLFFGLSLMDLAGAAWTLLALRRR